MDEVAVISAPEVFGPADHATLAQVAQVAGSKILDCSRIINVPKNLCEIATAGWAAPPGSVPRLAIVAQVDAWPLVRMLAPKAMAAVAAHGTELRVFYVRQLTSDHIQQWIRNGAEPPHELDATLNDLETVWEGSAMVGNVIDAVLEVIRTDKTPRRPEYFRRLAGVAQKFGEPGRAAAIIRET